MIESICKPHNAQSCDQCHWESVKKITELETALAKAEAEAVAMKLALVIAAVPLEACKMARSLTSDEGLMEVDHAVRAIRQTLSSTAGAAHLEADRKRDEELEKARKVCEDVEQWLQSCNATDASRKLLEKVKSWREARGA